VVISTGVLAKGRWGCCVTLLRWIAAVGLCYWSLQQSIQQRRTLSEGEASGIPQREKCREQSTGRLLLEKQGRCLRL
jgi:hypothetical protein